MNAPSDHDATGLGDFVSAEVVQQAGQLADRFATARPFRHVAIDGFFTAPVARQLAENFPAFDEKLAMNENGQVGAKAVNEQVRSLGPAWRRLDDLVQGMAFRTLISRITGVPHLQYDPHYFGGGTHENLHGQGLDAHVDFNFHPITRQHRRLNLIIYLSDEWRDEWGGSIQLHKDPYLPPAQDEIAVVTPLFNRCVIFETNEHSWHGFPRIELPEDKRDLSRRSFALYYYTDSRPAEELGPEHSTIYVEQHLPEDFGPGVPLAPEQAQHVRNLVTSRDQHLRRLYGNIKQLYTELNHLKERYGLQAPPGVADEPSPFEIANAVNLPPVEPEPDPDPESDPESGPVAESAGAPPVSVDGPDERDEALEDVLERQSREAGAEIARREARIRGLEQRVSELETSTSWRITRPIRRLKRLLAGG